MQYLSEFEILSEPIVPPALLPPGVSVPFVAQGYFVLISRLPDDIAGDLAVRLLFFPSVPFPPAANLLVDYEDGNGVNQLVALAANSVDVPIGSGKTVLVGIQPNITNSDPSGPLADGQFGARGYVMIDSAAPSAQGVYQLALVPEIRATFFTLGQAGGVPAPDLTSAAEVAYVLPSPSGGLITVTKAKESKEKEPAKDGKDGKDAKDRKDNKDGIKDKEFIKDGLKEKDQALEKLPFDSVPKSPKENVETPSFPGNMGDPALASSLASLADRLTNIEQLIAARAFIRPEERPAVG